MEERDRFTGKLTSSGASGTATDRSTEPAGGSAGLNAGKDDFVHKLESTMDRKMKELDDRYDEEFSKLEGSDGSETEGNVDANASPADEIEAQLRECNAALAALRERAEASKEEIRAQCMEQIEGLEQRLRAAGQTVRELGDSGATWPLVKERLGHALKDIIGAMRTIVTALRG